MFISRSIDPLVGGHGQAGDLVHLAHRQEQVPGEVGQGEDDHEHHPGVAGGQLGDAVPPGQVRGAGAGAAGEEGDQAPYTPHLHHQQDQEEHQEVCVIVCPNTVTHPGTVVVKPCHAPVAHRAVLRPDGPPHQAGHAEHGGVQPSSLHHLLDCLELVLVSGCDGAWVRPPGFQVAVPDSSG